MKDIAERNRELHTWVHIGGDLENAQKEKLKFESQGFNARLAPNEQNSVKYKVLIGPYNQKDDDLLRTLKQDQLIDKHSYWVRFEDQE